MSEVEYAEIFRELTGERCLGAVVMPGSRTNVNVHIFSENGEYAMRVPGVGTSGYIDRGAEIANLRQLSRFDFVPRLCWADEVSGVVITEYLAGAKNLTAECLEDDSILLGVSGILANLHSSGVAFGNEFDLSETKERYRRLLAAKGFSLPGEVDESVPVLEGVLSGLRGSGSAPCHGDLNLNNCMIQDGKLYLIDWEYSGMCDPLFDVANFVMTDRMDEACEARTLRAYEARSGASVDRVRYLQMKVSIDYMWIFWHLIKLSQGSMTEYNEFSWRNRLARALGNMRRLERA